MSSNGQLFVDFMKRIRYPKGNTLEAKAFDYLFDKEDLKQFLNVLRLHITEANVISPQELEQYENLQAATKVDPDLAARMKLMSSSSASASDVEETKAELEDEITCLEKDIKLLEHQRSILSKTKVNLLQKCEEAEQLQKVHRQKIRSFQDISVPAVISEINGVIHGGIAIVEECFKVLSVDSKADEIKPLFMEDLIPYIDSEKDLLRKLVHFLNHDFQEFAKEAGSLHVDPLVEDFLPEYSSGELWKHQCTELQKLQKNLRALELDHAKALVELAKSKHQLKYYEEITKNENNVFGLSAKDLQEQLQNAGELEVKRDEERMLMLLLDAISEEIDSKCSHVVSLSMSERIERYKQYIQWLQKVLDVVQSQGVRLELLRTSIMIQEQSIEKLKDVFLSFRTHLDKDVRAIDEYMQSIIEITSEIPNKDEMPKGSILSSIKAILNEISIDGQQLITKQDVSEKFKNIILEERESAVKCGDLLGEQLKIINALESSISVLDEEVCIVKGTGDFSHDLLDKFNKCLGKFSYKISEFEEKILERMTNFQKKKSIIMKNNSLAKRRYLFVYALTNREKFLKLVEDIEAEVWLHK